MGPLYKFGVFDRLYGLQLALLIGFMFGFLLERAGFGSPRKLTAVFYLRDFAVLKVMFTAIVVAMLGLLYFTLFGWLDLSKVYILPTFIWPHVVGGFVLGVGFIMGGYCPTTSLVAAVSGKVDGLVFILGMMTGVFVFAEAFPLISGFYGSGQMGAVRLGQVLHLNSGTVAALVCLLAVAAFWLGEKVENRFGEKELLPAVPRRFKLFGATLLVALGLILMAANPDRAATRAPALPAKQVVKEAPEKPGPAPEQQGVTGFKIVDDEGC